MTIINATNVTIEDIRLVTNVTSFPELFIKVNHYVYDGWLYFILLLTLWIILILVGQMKNDNIMENILYSGSVVTVGSLLMRGVYIMELGVDKGLLVDSQAWFFPIITILFAMISWWGKKS